ncbi:hypothetical protein [Shimazuella alba]|uniref:hypothetical protein n=1 Tax=Shimazuella alba TaxID=2690964 RepID=UPI001F3CA434|nr:hypothetical protein [Shimazuella alba]
MMAFAGFIGPIFGGILTGLYWRYLFLFSIGVFLYINSGDDIEILNERRNCVKREAFSNVVREGDFF